jgi:hypothetical protein
MVVVCRRLPRLKLFLEKVLTFYKLCGIISVQINKEMKLMAKTFYVRTHTMTCYDNLIRVDEEDMKEYQNERPDLTEKEIIAQMFADGTCEVLDATPTAWRDEVVDTVQEFNITEDEENV